MLVTTRASASLFPLQVWIAKLYKAFDRAGGQGGGPKAIEGDLQSGQIYVPRLLTFALTQAREPPDNPSLVQAERPA